MIAAAQARLTTRARPDMLQLENQTPFAPSIAVLPDRKAIDTLYVIVKATMNLRPRLGLAETQLPVAHGRRVLRRPGELEPEAGFRHAHRQAGHGRAAHRTCVGTQRSPTTQTDVTVSVAERRKTVRVFGDRDVAWRAPTAPAAFQSMPLVWERAFGGIHRTEDRVFAEERNPIGCGFRGKRSARSAKGSRSRISRIPSAPLQSLGQNPVPACFAPISPSWLPRRAYAGTYDANWQKQRAPYLPDDFDPRFLQCAAPELTFDRYLEGGEPVEIHGASNTGPIGFTLPTARPIIEVMIAGAETGAVGEPRDAADRAGRKSRQPDVAGGVALRSDR